MSASLRAAAAATICAGYDGEPAGVPAALGALPGGVILFARNAGPPERVGAQLAALRALYAGEAPPLLAVDQEGGRVARLRDGMVEMPSMMALGACADETLAQRAGAQLGRDLARYGLNLDLAPVLDLALEPRNAAIGARALGGDPHRVARLGGALVRGFTASGVGCAGKHFPGHGATLDDSHVALPSLDADIATLNARELVPFRAAIAAGVPAIMAAHVRVLAVDPAHPASLSAPVLDRLLRRQLGFTGVVFTDALEMHAIAGQADTGAAAAAALAAGADCICASAGIDAARAAIDGIVAAVERGELKEARVHDAAARVHAMRRRFASALVDADGPDDREVGLAIARGAVTVLRGNPVVAGDAPVTVVSFEGATTEGAQGMKTGDGSLNAALRSRRRKSEMLRIPLEPAPDDLGLLLDLLRTPVPRTVAIVTRRASLLPGQRAAVDALLEAAPDALLVCAREPYDADCFPQARTIVCTYGDEQVSFDGLADVIAGRIGATGTLPVTLAGWPLGSGLAGS